MSGTPPGTSALRILVVDDDPNIRLTLSMCLEGDGHDVVACGSIDEALTETSRRVFDLVFLDIRLGVQNGLDFIPQLLSQSPWARVVVITAFASIETAIRAMKQGAADYLPKPFTPIQVQTVTQRVAERRMLEWKIQSLQAVLGSDPEADLPTTDADMQRAIAMARNVADSKATVLIQGEIGGGKGRLARAIHAWSARRDGPLAIVSCDTPAAEQLEAELFGVVGRLEDETATRPIESPGRASFAEGGTLVLEEIGKAPPSLGAKILHLVRDKEYERQNDFKLRRADVRIVATSSFPLQNAVDEKRMRAELQLALEVVKIELPPLRSRPGDIPMLARRYLAFFGQENHRPIAGFTPDAMHALKQHAWPGNVRELRNVIERAVLLCNDDHIGLKDLPPNLLAVDQACAIGDLVPLETIERMHTQSVLSAAGTIRSAAAILGVHENTLARWVRRNATTAQASNGEMEASLSPNCSDDQSPS